MLHFGCRISLPQKLLITLQVLGVKSITFLDIIDRHILPAFNSDQACQLSSNVLVSYLAFISLSGLLSTSKFDAAPDTAQGKKLLKQLQQSAIIWTNRGATKVANNEAIHFPVSLGNQVCLDSPSCYVIQKPFSFFSFPLPNPTSILFQAKLYTKSGHNNILHTACAHLLRKSHGGETLGQETPTL